MKSGSVKLLSRRIIGRNARRFRNDTPDGKERHAAVRRAEIYSTFPNAPCRMIFFLSRQVFASLQVCPCGAGMRLPQGRVLRGKGRKNYCAVLSTILQFKCIAKCGNNLYN